jgi:predicted ATPase
MTSTMLNTLAVSNYRSLRNLVIPLGQLSVLTGPNGSGKSNIYRALRLLADTARGGVVASLSREGGFESTLWAGPESFFGDASTLANAISDAFPGSELEVRGTDGGLSVFLHQHGLLRPLSAAELSDGTLRYLLWAAALLTPRPPRPTNTAPMPPEN